MHEARQCSKSGSNVSESGSKTSELLELCSEQCSPAPPRITIGVRKPNNNTLMHCQFPGQIDWLPKCMNQPFMPLHQRRKDTQPQKTKRTLGAHTAQAQRCTDFQCMRCKRHQPHAQWEGAVHDNRGWVVGCLLNRALPLESNRQQSVFRKARQGERHAVSKPCKVVDDLGT